MGSLVLEVFFKPFLGLFAVLFFMRSIDGIFVTEDKM
jgi:hypothetical protein